MQILQSADFWIGLAKIVWINVILSGDNAVVIALAARTLPPQQRRQAVSIGAGAAVVLRVALTVVAARLLDLPYAQVVGGLLLLWIGTHLLASEDEAKPDEQGRDGADRATLFAAVRTILLADLVMSLDNVIAVAAAARGNPLLLVLGLGLSIPLVIFGSTLMIRLMERFPVIVLFGAAIIGWVAGDTIAGDSALRQVVADLPWLRHVASVAGALGVLALGHVMNRRALARQAGSA